MRTLLLAFWVVLADACGSGGALTAESESTAYSPEMTIKEVMPDAVGSSFAPQSEPAEMTRQVVKTGNIDFQTLDLAATYSTIKSILPQYEAFIEHDNQSASVDRLNRNMTIRVPASKYDSLVAQIGKEIYRLNYQSTGVEDVTGQYFDLEIRISNAKALEARYLDILKKAHEIKDLLEIEQKLNQVRTEIEQLESQFSYLSKRIAYSTLTLNFYEELPYVLDGEKRPGFFVRIQNALRNGWDGFLSFTVGVISLWPYWLLLVAGFWGFRKWKKRKSA